MWNLLGGLEDASGHAHDYHDAEVKHLVRALRGYGVLTRDGLREVAGADSWTTGTFEGALAVAVRTGAIKSLTDDLFELPAEE
jgi:hypothetical protein